MKIKLDENLPLGLAVRDALARLNKVKLFLFKLRETSRAEALF
jgi:hypothetical protein